MPSVQNYFLSPIKLYFFKISGPNLIVVSAIYSALHLCCIVTAFFLISSFSNRDFPSLSCLLSCQENYNVYYNYNNNKYNKYAWSYWHIFWITYSVAIIGFNPGRKIQYSLEVDGEEILVITDARKHGINYLVVLTGDLRILLFNLVHNPL